MDMQPIFFFFFLKNPGHKLPLLTLFFLLKILVMSSSSHSIFFLKSPGHELLHFFFFFFAPTGGGFKSVFKNWIATGVYSTFEWIFFLNNEIYFNFLLEAFISYNESNETGESKPLNFHFEYTPFWVHTTFFFFFLTSPPPPKKKNNKINQSGNFSGTTGVIIPKFKE